MTPCKRLISVFVSAPILCLTLGCSRSEHAAPPVKPSAQAKVNAPQAAEAPAIPVDPRKRLAEISPAIPLYPDVEYRADQSHRDEMTVRNQFGSDTQVYTMSTEASFPEVWHYYATYMAQFRGYTPPPPYPNPAPNRTLQISLNEAMSDPFIPGDAIRQPNTHVVLQVAERDQEPTVIRYILTSHPVGDQPVALQ